jgi:hypothetical protein
MAKTIRKRMSKRIKIHMSENSIELLIQRREWPEGGLAQLQSTIRGDMDWVYKMMRHLRGPTNKAQYNRFMNQLSASIYCFSSQGRISAINDLKYSQAAELFQEGVVLSTKFKTRTKFGYQPVTLPPDKESTVLMKAYVTLVRPKLLMGLDDPLFINYGGTAKYDIAKGVRNYFSQTLNLHLHTNRIRSIVETQMQDLLEEGIITPLQKSAIEHVNGHDSETTRDYYVKKKRKQDAHNAFKAFDIFDANVGHVGRPIDDTFETSVDNHFETSVDSNFETPFDDSLLLESFLEDYVDVQEPMQLQVTQNCGVIGCKHPHFDALGSQMRAPWTEEEVDFVGNWCTKNILDHPEWEKTIVSKCTKYIKSTPAVRELFHPLHVTDSSRLRHGLEVYYKKQKK